MKLFFISSGLFPIIIALDWDNLIPKEATNNSKALIGIGLLYGSIAFFPQKLKYILPVFGLLKLAVFWDWLRKKCPMDTRMTISLGDFSYGIVFFIAFNELRKQKN